MSKELGILSPELTFSNSIARILNAGFFYTIIKSADTNYIYLSEKHKLSKIGMNFAFINGRS